VQPGCEGGADYWFWTDISTRERQLESRVDQIPFSGSQTEGDTWHEPQLPAWCDQVLIGYIFLYLLMPTRLATRLSGIFR